MKEKTNEWMSISDLMAGTVSVIVMLLVVSILQQAISSMKQKLSENQDLVTQKEPIEEMFREVDDDFKREDIDLVSFDYDNFKITFKEGIFEKGSAKVTTDVQKVLYKTKPKVLDYLSKLENGVIYIEGHTDNSPVHHPVINKEKYGAVYDDNYTLSAARAREARNVLLGDISDQYANRIIVAGYGYSKPLKGLDPGNAANRRIEIRFVLENPANGK